MLDLQKFGNIPFNYAALEEMLPDYQSPYDKVAAMEKHGDIVRLKKGLYVVSDKISRKPVSRELIANHLYGASYISLETALSHYGLIPEKVFAVRSVTPKRAKQYENAFGRFEYVTVPAGYYSIGIHQQIVDNEYAYLIATPEKAICDLILATPRLRLQSVRAVQNYLEDDLRMDFSAVEHWDTEIVRQCAEVRRKKGELGLVEEFLAHRYINMNN
jgi:predicted transcriptional regulator of viral defense system